MNTKGKQLRIFLVALMCLTMMIPTAASPIEEDSIFPRYMVVTRFEASLSIGNDGCCTCGGKSAVNPGYTAEVTMELQQKNGSSWRTVKTWTANNRIVEMNENYYVDSGYDYRVKLSAVVTNSSGKAIEEPEAYSAVWHY